MGEWSPRDHLGLCHGILFPTLWRESSWVGVWQNLPSSSHHSLSSAVSQQWQNLISLKHEHLVGFNHMAVVEFSSWFFIPAGFPALVSSCRHSVNILKAESPGKRGLLVSGGVFMIFCLLICITCWWFPEEPVWKGLPSSRVWEVWPLWSPNSCYFQIAFTQLFENTETHARIYKGHLYFW